MMKPVKSLTPLIERLRARGFINHTAEKKGKSGGSAASYGPLGALMRHKIKSQWWDAMVKKQSNVFPIEGLQPSSENLYRSATKMTSIGNLQTDCLSAYPQVLRLTNGQFPFSIASVGACKSCEEMKKSAERDFLLRTPERTRLLLQNYTPSTGSSQVLDYWLQLRLSWWKKYSRKPAHFQAVASSSLNSSKNSNQSEEEPRDVPSSSSQNRLSIVYEFPWGVEVIEEVANLGDSMVKRLPEEQRFKSKSRVRGKQPSLPHCIQCSTTLEVAMAALLVDAYHERTPVTAKKGLSVQNSDLVLQLHNEISPYQVAIAREPAVQPPDDLEVLGRITSVSERLSKDLQSEGVSVFETTTQGASLLAHFRRNDQLGIPYTVILSADTLDSGVISVRHRDTELQEESHISSVSQKLKRYLDSQLE